jgi:hypothetical protein
MLQGDEAVAKTTLQRAKPSAISLIDEDDHGGPAAKLEDGQGKPPSDVRRMALGGVPRP